MTHSSLLRWSVIGLWFTAACTGSKPEADDGHQLQPVVDSLAAVVFDLSNEIHGRTLDYALPDVQAPSTPAGIPVEVMGMPVPVAGEVPAPTAEELAGVRQALGSTDLARLRIVYQQDDLRASGIVDTLQKAGFSAAADLGSARRDSSNAILFGDSVPEAAVQYVALVMLREGVPAKRIRTTTDSLHRFDIVVTRAPHAQYLTPLSPRQVRALRRMPSR